MTSTPWPAAWLKGFLEATVLAVVAQGETYGYEITGSLQAAGFGQVKGGTLYPILGRLEESGWVQSRWEAGDGGPGRKYYTLTASGQEELAERASTWHAFSHTISHLMKEHQR